MTKIVNLVGQTMTGSATTTRNQSAITRIVRHHSATTGGDVFAFQNSWRNLGWHTGGYHEVILRDGTVQIAYNPTTITNGARNQNHNTYHICVVGNGSFTAEQERVFEERARFNMNRFGLGVNAVVGHQELPGQATACPGIAMNTVRGRLRQPIAPTPSTGNTHTVRSGENLTRIANQHNTTVTAIMVANPIINNPNHISVGQVLNLPSGTQATQTFFFPRADGSGIVAALNSIRVDSSFANRTRIANANGIGNFTGSAAQNTQMLNLLRNGRLVRP